VIGDVEVGAESSIWFHTVVRGDVMGIRIGRRTNIQDLSLLHGTTGKFGVVVGDEVTVGHRAIIHGARIASRVLIGMGAVILDGVVIEEGVIVAAGAVVPPNTIIPPRKLVAGVPARVLRDVTDEEWEGILHSCQRYLELSREYRDFYSESGFFK
jgi:carbonic anhydrase/acetyltransferase-like protein (isoleucine patch superfamily)